MKDEVKLQLRLPADIRDWLKRYAEQHNRSMNGQVVEVLANLKASETRKAPNA